LLAIDRKQDQFFSPSRQELEKCSRDENTIFCPPQNVMLKNKDNYCLLHLFFNRQETFYCAEKFIKFQDEYWVKLATSNSWLFAFSNITKVQLHCDTTNTEYLQGTSKIIIEKDCKITTATVTLFPHQDFKSEIFMNFTLKIGNTKYSDDSEIQ
jgi:hypothetical protein